METIAGSRTSLPTARKPEVRGKTTRTGRDTRSRAAAAQAAPRSSLACSDFSGSSWDLPADLPQAHSTTLTEEQIRSLVNRARHGDDAAFELLVKHYQNRIYNHVARMVQDPAEAEDLAQEAFVRAYQALPHFRGEASFQTWVYRIASNLAIDASRRRKRRQWQTVSLDEPLDDEESSLARDLADGTTRTPDEVVESSSLRDQVWSAIAELSEKLRPVVVLYDLQGLSYEEIARILGCPLGTVKSRLFNARCQLRDKLRRRLPEDILVGLMGPVQSRACGTTAL